MTKPRKMRWAWQVPCTGEKNVYRVLVGFPEGLKPRCRWEDNTKMNLRETDDWINLAQDRDQCLALVSMVMNFQVQ
jgi:hypothetical protein